MPGPRQPSDSSSLLSLGRREILIVTGTGIVSHLVGCNSDDNGSKGSGGSGGGSSAAGSGGSGGGAGAGGSGGASGGTGGGGGGGGGGAGGATGGSGGSAVDAGAGGSGGAQADAGQFAADARIEAGSPAGMVDGATAACRITSADQLGPYYLNGMPARTVLTNGGEGMRLIVTGKVLNTRCEPLADASLDIWSANGKGVYSEQASGWCRGNVKTDSDGSYMFETVYPGPYLGRPRHIHFMISHAGYGKLTTQMYWKGEDPDIAANAVSRTMVNGAWQSEWVIVLRQSGMAVATPRIHRPEKLSRRFWGPFLRPLKSA